MNSKSLLSALALAFLLQGQPAGISKRLSQVFSDSRDKDLALQKLAGKDYPSLQSLLDSRATANKSEIECIKGSLSFLAGAMNESIVHFNNAAAAAPLDDADAFTWAMAYIKLGDSSHAQMLLINLSARHPERSLYIYWLGRIDYDLRLYPEAAKKLEKAIALDPKSVRAWNALGLAYDMAGQAEQAYQPFNKAAQLNREQAQPSPWPPHDLGNWYLRNSRWKDAECAFTEALKYDPAMPQAHYHLGRALEKEQREAEAVDEYKSAMTIDKSNADACYSLAMLYRKLHRDPEAAAMLAEYKSRKAAH